VICCAAGEIVDKILAALDAQKKQFMQQIATIDMARAIYVKGTGNKTAKRGKGKHTLSAAARKKISIAQKKRWAAQKKLA
jgi:hypothetical protein